MIKKLKADYEENLAKRNALKALKEEKKKEIKEENKELSEVKEASKDESSSLGEQLESDHRNPSRNIKLPSLITVD